VGADLVTKEVEIDPLFGGAPFFATDHLSKEFSCGFNVIYWKRKVEWSHFCYV
jgi:hypothetical protein